jgi:hypothetical protein
VQVVGDVQISQLAPHSARTKRIESSRKRKKQERYKKEEKKEKKKGHGEKRKDHNTSAFDGLGGAVIVLTNGTSRGT